MADAPASTAQQTPPRTAAERIRDAELSDLSNVELLERMALLISQRREGRSSGPAPIADGFAAPANEMHEPAPVPAPPPASSAQVPLDPPAPIIPAALRPLELGDEEEDDFSSWAPPRHIGSAPLATAGEVSEADNTFAEVDRDVADAGQSATPAIPQAYAPDEDRRTVTEAPGSDDNDSSSSEEEDLLEEGYSSLLNLSRPASARDHFVRIEEPEAPAHEIEPVVVFPGQEARHSQSAAQHTLPREPDSQPQGEPVGAPKREDAEKSEQALRAALATLQRMSGAA